MFFSYNNKGDIVFNNLRNYIEDNNLHINIDIGIVNIINYLDVLSLNEDQIKIKYQKGTIVINGKKLAINKMLDKEILIIGEIKSIEFI